MLPPALSRLQVHFVHVMASLRRSQRKHAVLVAAATDALAARRPPARNKKKKTAAPGSSAPLPPPPSPAEFATCASPGIQAAEATVQGDSVPEGGLGPEADRDSLVAMFSLDYL